MVYQALASLRKMVRLDLNLVVWKLVQKAIRESSNGIFDCSRGSPKRGQLIMYFKERKGDFSKSYRESEMNRVKLIHGI